MRDPAKARRWRKAHRLAQMVRGKCLDCNAATDGEALKCRACQNALNARNKERRRLFRDLRAFVKARAATDPEAAALFARCPKEQPKG